MKHLHASGLPFVLAAHRPFMAKFAIATTPSASDLSTLSGTVSSLSSSVSTLSSDVTTLEGDVTANTADILSAGGRAISLDDVIDQTNGDGTTETKTAAITIPSGVKQTNHLYRINGNAKLTAGAADNPGGSAGTSNQNNPLFNINYRDVLLKWTGSSWSLVGNGDSTVDAAPGLTGSKADYFSADSHLPFFGDDSGALKLFTTVASGAHLTIAFDGSIADLGTA